MQERKVVEEILERQFKVEGFFDKKDYHVIVKDRETGEVFKNGKGEDLKNALLCLRGTGIPYPLNPSILDIEEKMKKEGRQFMAWKEPRLGMIFYLSCCDPEGFYREDMIALAVGSDCKVLQIGDVAFKFYRKGEERRSVKIVASQGERVFRSFVGSGEDIAEAAKMALNATHPEYCRKKRA